MNALAPPPSSLRPDAPPAAGRWDAVDAARGLAIVAMVVYHAAWDLSFLKLVAFDAINDPAWKAFARAIASSFLALVGVSLALAHARGVRRAAFLRRLAKIGGAALLVTAATILAFPDAYIFFGILHAIAVSSVLALPFLRAPWPVAALAALAVAAAPRFLTSPALDHPALDWLGLGAADPITNDYVPVFPWFAAVLLGLLLGRALLSRGTGPLARWRAAAPPSRALVRAGRWSLPIYLVHQPILLALFYGVLQITGPNPAAEAQTFIRPCAAGCIGADRDEALCTAICRCTADRLRIEESLWRAVLGNRVAPEDRPRVNGLAQQCYREQRRPGD
ncbi:MAG TPA: heparan-alpha-glucosaminide N-acetyltransferase [Microvirga sp.]|nr:heparan-alpha-glucosaminide N-acetyltransferase [Microvirga sp.]